jgi:hypothetical protein
MESVLCSYIFLPFHDKLGHFLVGFFFFSVLRQFKIAKPTQQPVEKKLLKQFASACCMHVKHKKKMIYFIYQQKKYSTKFTNRK